MSRGHRWQSNILILRKTLVLERARAGQSLGRTVLNGFFSLLRVTFLCSSTSKIRVDILTSRATIADREDISCIQYLVPESNGFKSGSES
jgi:hypothetical protein